MKIATIFNTSRAQLKPTLRATSPEFRHTSFGSALCRTEWRANDAKSRNIGGNRCRALALVGGPVAIRHPCCRVFVPVTLTKILRVPHGTSSSSDGIIVSPVHSTRIAPAYVHRLQTNSNVCIDLAILPIAYTLNDVLPESDLSRPWLWD